MPSKIVDGPPDPYALAYANFAIKQLEELFAQISRERRLCWRYLGKALAERRKALKAWCAFNRDENLNSGNELNLQLYREYWAELRLLVPAQAAVQQTTANAQDHAHNVCYPVVEVRAAIETGLDEFNGAAERRGADED